jgi:hypothetical protein
MVSFCINISLTTGSRTSCAHQAPGEHFLAVNKAAANSMFVERSCPYRFQLDKVHFRHCRRVNPAAHDRQLGRTVVHSITKSVDVCMSPVCLSTSRLLVLENISNGFADIMSVWQRFAYYANNIMLCTSAHTEHPPQLQCLPGPGLRKDLLLLSPPASV